MPPKKAGGGTNKRAVSKGAKMGNASSRAKTNDKFVDAREMKTDDPPPAHSNNRKTIINLQEPRVIKKSAPVDPPRPESPSPSITKRAATWRPVVIPPPPVAVPVVPADTVAVEEPERAVSPTFTVPNQSLSPARPLSEQRPLSPARPLPLPLEQQPQQYINEYGETLSFTGNEDELTNHTFNLPQEVPPLSNYESVFSENENMTRSHYAYAYHSHEQLFYLNQRVARVNELKPHVDNICKETPRTLSIDSEELACVAEYIWLKPEAPIVLYFNVNSDLKPISERFDLMRVIRENERYEVAEAEKVGKPLVINIVVQLLACSELTLTEDKTHLQLKQILQCCSDVQGREELWQIFPFKNYINNSPDNWADIIKSPSPPIWMLPSSPPNSKEKTAVAKAPSAPLYYRTPDETTFPQYEGNEMPYILQMNDKLPTFSMHTNCTYGDVLRGLQHVGGIGMLPDTIIPFTWDDDSATLDQLYHERKLWEEKKIENEEDTKRANIWLRTISFYTQILLRQDGITMMEIIHMHLKYTMFT